MRKYTVGNNSKRVSIVKDPSCPYNEDSVYSTVVKGEKVTVDDSRVLYDWHGNTYYRVDDGVHYDAYIITTALEEV